MREQVTGARPASSAIVIDDEPLARSRLRRLLEKEGVEVVAEADNGQAAVDIVGDVPADILFIDIHMPIMNGLQAVSVINQSYQHPPAIVFCTAYEEYAVQAFKTNAVAYLLKPVSSEDLRESIAGASKVNRVQLASVATAAHAEIIVLEPTISVHIGGTLEKLSIKSFSSFRSMDKNVFGQMRDGTEIMVNYTLKELEHIFTDQVVRVHRSALVNKLLVQKLVRGKSGVASVVLTDDSEFPVSRRHLSEVKQCFS